MTVSPNALESQARKRYCASTGTEWKKVPAKERRRWMDEILPVLRKEHGIATDAVWRDGAWVPAEQGDLFDLLTGPEVAQ
jgi:hypothetical protein